MHCVHLQGDIAFDVREDASFVERVPLHRGFFLGGRYRHAGYPYLSEEILVVAVLVVVVHENLDGLSGKNSMILDSED